MCQDPAWRQPIATSCPNRCGMCLDGGCVDKAVDCSADTSICNNINLQAFVNENCQRTCQRCPASTTIGTATTQPGVVTTAPTSCTDSSTRTASVLQLSTLQHRNLNTALRPAVCAQENNHFQLD
ncbi:hypothetical protein WR25_05333 [Diploscapter pachys]|uniref:ShKT domain-containing protein n=1 Tax=Diploscapter pachys TaxID=2018661 RepID=A0A2A2LIZ8_9BILA|nr:hypothetical protein WR25_05333 [Diploscapter pachys]